MSWQGRLTIAIYLLVLLSVFRKIDVNSHSVSDTLIGFFLPFVIITAIFIAICVLKGEKASWRWRK